MKFKDEIVANYFIEVEALADNSLIEIVITEDVVVVATLLSLESAKAIGEYLIKLKNNLQKRNLA